MANLTPSGGNADLAGQTVVTLDGYEVTYDSNGYVRQSLSPTGEVKYYDSLGNETKDPAKILVSPASDPQVPVLPVSTQMPITDTIPASNIGSTSTTTNTPSTTSNLNNTLGGNIQTSDNTNTGFVYNSSGELVPADSVAGQEAVAQNDAALTQNIIDQANEEPSYYPEETDRQAQQRVQNQMTGESNGYFGTAYDDEGNLNPGWTLDEENNPVYLGTNTSDGSLFIEPATTAQAASDRASAEKARLQQTISKQRQTQNNGDWRVKLRLAPQADYLYKSASPGILQPLQVTDGVIFPYTPSIDTAYRANYDPYDPTHSNYRGYFYKNSYVEGLNLRCLFTAQSTAEANYLLATIHFFRSVTKMFYGQDPAHRGSPPPIVYLTGFGEYQFKEHSCVVSQFNYSLPADVDYIRARSTPYNNTNLEGFRKKKTTMAGGLLGGMLGGAVDRLMNAGGKKGGIFQPPSPPTLGEDSPTYVPTKMEISLTLLPIQSRAQVSQQFSLKQFGSGDLLKGGFW